MKTTLKTSALSNIDTASVHLPTPASTFGLGFRQYLASAPRYEDDVSDEPCPPKAVFRQPVEFLEAVPTIAATTRPASTSALNVQDSLARCLGAALLLAARPTQQAPALRQAVMALRQA